MSAPTITTPLACPQCGAPVTLPGYADLAVCQHCGSSLAGVALPSPAASSVAAPAAAQDEYQVLRSLSCPQCAGSLSVRAGHRILLCDHCGVRVLNHGEGGVPHWLFPQHTDRIHALSAAARWLTEHPGIAKAARDVPVRQATLVHVPIWEHTCLIAGWESGVKLRTKSHLVSDGEGAERLELSVEEESFQDPYLQERRYYQEAHDLEDLGASRPRFSGRELLLPLVAGEIDPSSEVMEPEGTAGAIADTGRKLALMPASGASDPHARMLALRESVSLLYYPLWLVDYQVAGRPYRIVIDARKGTVNSATAPAADARKAPELLLKAAALLVVMVLAAWSAVIWEAARMPLITLAVIVFLAALLLVLRSPSGGKVEYHEPFSS